jgi:hypothetical protein
VFLDKDLVLSDARQKFKIGDRRLKKDVVQVFSFIEKSFTIMAEFIYTVSLEMKDEKQ